MASNLKMTVSADTSKAVEELKKLGARIAAVSGAIMAVQKLSKAGIELMKVGSEEAIAEQRLSSILKATGNQLGINYWAMRRYASSISTLTGMEEKTILAAEQTLVAFGTLNSEGFERTLDLATDVSMALGTDISQAAKKLGEVLSEPTSGLDGLKEIGIIFTQQEKEQIAAVREANGLFAAQALVLDKVEKSYGGVAKNIGNSSSNLLTKISETWDDIKTGLGQGLLDTVSPALEVLYNSLVKIKEWADKKEITSDVRTEIENSTTSENLAKSFDKPILEEFVQTQTDLMSKASEQLDNEYASWLYWQGRGRANPGEWQNDSGFMESAAFLDSNTAKSAYKQYQNASYLANAAAEAIPYTKPEEDSPATSPTQTVSVVSDAKTWKKFMQSYGSNSTSYQAALYDDQIGQAESLMKQMKSKDGSWNKTTMREWGIGYTSDMEDLYTQLGEVMDATKAKRDALFAAPGDTSLKDEIDALIRQHSSLSESYSEDQVADQLSKIDSLISQIGDSTDPVCQKQLKYLEEIRAGLTTTESALSSNLDSILSSYGNLSQTYQNDKTAESIANIKAALDELGEDNPAKTYLQEILDSLETVEDKSVSVKDSILAIGDSVFSTFSSISSSMATIYKNQASAMESSMKKQKENGDLTVAEEAEMQEKIDALKKKAFDAEKANSLATATVSLANGTMSIWEQWAANPIVAGILTAGLGATYAAQVAAIASQQYTPMATGGIVTGPTHILAGEAGPEAIIPLKDRKARDYLGESSSPVIVNITIQGNADEEIVFNAIERAQRTGLLPSWRYTR